MPRQRDGGKVPGVLCLTGDADHRAGAEATIWIMCSTMYRMHPAYMLWSLEHLAQYEVVNQITVAAETANEALVALDRMLAVR